MSFWELLVVVVVGLLVVGPERLPEALRTGIRWFSRAKRTINDTRAEFEQQLGMDEIRRELHNEQVMKSLKALEQTEDDVRSGLSRFEADMNDEIARIENSADDPTPEHESHNDFDDQADSHSAPKTESELDTDNAAKNKA